MKVLKARGDARRPALRLLREQDGISLVEMMVSIAISVLVFSVLSSALVQFVLSTRWGNHQLQVTNDIQVSSLWLGRDAPESASFTPGSGAEYGTLSWADSSQQYRYSYNAADSALVREHFEDGVLQSTTTTARHIADQSDVTFNLTGKLLTVVITSSSGEESETVSMDFALRTR